MLGPMRIAYAVVVLTAFLVMGRDLELFFAETGVMPLAVSQAIIDSDTWTLFQWLPSTTTVLWACYTVMIIQLVALGAGFFSRVQAASVFIWLISFQHRHIILFDGEDVLFRIIAFCFIFAPIGRTLSVDAWWARRRGRPLPTDRTWPLRLLQLQMSAVYLSTALQKSFGETWLRGDAMYYVARLDDLFGRFPVPAVFVESLALIYLTTWAVLALEFLAPFGLWFKETRRPTLVCCLVFHLATDYTMNLFMFQWIMLVGLLAFVRVDDWDALMRLVQRRSPEGVPGSTRPHGRAGASAPSGADANLTAQSAG